MKARKLDFRGIALAIDPFESKMLASFIRKKIDPNIGIIPMVINTLDKMNPDLQDPEINFERAFDNDFVSIKKRENFWKR